MERLGVTRAPMNLDPSWLLLSLIPGAIGVALLMYGKKQARWPQVVFGLLFIVYPYFTNSVTSLLVVGVLLGGALWSLLRTGR